MGFQETASLCLLNKDDDIESFLTKCFGSRQYKKKYDYKKVGENEFLVSLNILNNKRIFPRSEIKENLILKKTSSFLLVAKPYNLHCHPLSYLENDNLLTYLRDRNYSDALNVNQDHYDRGLLFRLDFVTSGLVILSHDHSILKAIRGNFHKFILRKVYLAIVQGHFTSGLDEEVYLTPSFKKGSKIKASNDRISDRSVKAHSLIRGLNYNKEKNLSLVSVEIKTGHRHQIRSHLSFLGYPILGDNLYGGTVHDRVYLHAYQYEILHPKSEIKKVFTCERCDLFNQFFNLDIAFDKINQ